MTDKTKTIDQRASDEKKLTDAELSEIVGGLQATSSDSERAFGKTILFNADVSGWDTTGGWD